MFLSSILTILVSLYNIKTELKLGNYIILNAKTKKRDYNFVTKNKLFLDSRLIKTPAEEVKVHLLKEKYIKGEFVGIAGIIIRHKILPSLFLLINKKYWNKGYGKELTKEVLKSKKGLLFLTVSNANIYARKIYKKLGFIDLMRWKKKSGEPTRLMVHL